MLTHRGLVVVVATLLVAIAATLTFAQMRASTLAAHEEQRTAARVAFDRELDDLRADLVAPAGNAEAAADMLETTLAELVAGSDRDRDEVLGEVEGHVDRLRTSAADLVAAAGQSPPTRPAVLPVAEIDPVLEHVAALDDQAAVVADDLLAAADAAEELAGAVHRLSDAAATFAASVDDLPDTDDPDQLAAAWQDELDRLEPYGEAAEQAADVEGLAPLADVHHAIVDALTELAEGAVEDLEDGDVDGYNDRLDEVLDRHDRDTVRDELTDATTEVLEAGVFVQLQAGRERVLGLKAELDTLTREPVEATA